MKYYTSDDELWDDAYNAGWFRGAVETGAIACFTTLVCVILMMALHR